MFIFTLRSIPLGIWSILKKSRTQKGYIFGIVIKHKTDFSDLLEYYFVDEDGIVSHGDGEEGAGTVKGGKRKRRNDSEII